MTTQVQKQLEVEMRRLSMLEELHREMQNLEMLKKLSEQLPTPKETTQSGCLKLVLTTIDLKLLYVHESSAI